MPCRRARRLCAGGGPRRSRCRSRPRAPSPATSIRPECGVDADAEMEHRDRNLTRRVRYCCFWGSSKTGRADDELHPSVRHAARCLTVPSSRAVDEHVATRRACSISSEMRNAAGVLEQLSGVFSDIRVAALLEGSGKPRIRSARKPFRSARGPSTAGAAIARSSFSRSFRRVGLHRHDVAQCEGACRP